MEDLKKEIGKKIKIARIENGQAMITLPKMMFLAEKLGVPIQNLIDVDKMEIPKRYIFV